MTQCICVPRPSLLAHFAITITITIARRRAEIPRGQSPTSDAPLPFLYSRWKTFPVWRFAKGSLQAAGLRSPSRHLYRRYGLFAWRPVICRCATLERARWRDPRPNLRLKGREEKWSAISPARARIPLSFSPTLFFQPLLRRYAAASLFHYIFRANRASRDNAVHTHRTRGLGEGEALIQRLTRV